MLCCRVKTATTHITSVNGLPTLMEYSLSALPTVEHVADTRFMHANHAGPNRGDALLAATDTLVYTLAEQ